MNRRLVAAAAAVLLVLAAASLWRGGRTTAQSSPVPALTEDLASHGPTLPLAQVIFFNSGVGYFQREGQVEGDANVQLAFPVGEIDDLLKSLVLQDAGGGRVSGVEFENHDPLEKTLQSFALDLTYNPTIGQLLNQARGEKIEIVLRTFLDGEAGSVHGTLLGMETRLNEKAVEEDVVNLLTANGLRSVPLVQCAHRHGDSGRLSPGV